MISIYAGPKAGPIEDGRHKCVDTDESVRQTSSVPSWRRAGFIGTAVLALFVLFALLWLCLLLAVGMVDNISAGDTATGIEGGVLAIVGPSVVVLAWRHWRARALRWDQVLRRAVVVGVVAVYAVFLLALLPR